jgi:hypothetical protein
MSQKGCFAGAPRTKEKNDFRRPIRETETGAATSHLWEKEPQNRIDVCFTISPSPNSRGMQGQR